MQKRLIWPTATAALALIAAPSLFAQSKERVIEELPPPSQRLAEAMVQIERIKAYDDAGPMLNAVITYDPKATFNVDRAADTPLQGRTVLIKDNIETRDFPTTGGSLALKDNRTGRDAPLVANLRAAGGVVLGKTNLSEWANIRSDGSTSGWSAVGGLTRNPFATDRNSCGSSSGSGAAVAAGFAWAAIGTETNGSISCPASINGVVGFKPSVGVVSRRHVIPISETQDTAGPMTRTVYDAALLLSAMAGEDEGDPVTMIAPRMADYTLGLDTASLKGVRIGVMRKQIGSRDDVAAVFEAALADLERAGAVLVDIEFEPNRAMYRDSFTVLMYELRAGMEAYLGSIPAIGGDEAATPRNLADLIAFNKANAAAEMRWFGQELFEQALETTDTEAYEKARANAQTIAGPETIDTLLADNDVKLLIAPTRGPAWVSDLVNGDNFTGSIGFGAPAAIAGYPHLTVPMGAVEGLPVGISFIGGQWADYTVLKAGAAYERARTAELPEPTFKPWSAE
ncbi:MAG: amidase [Pseudomonadota bacterium]